jgi:Mrp family chromosome partitioning ATPase/NifU-like protein involved in Fe-S cluster formation/predicted Fe-Mo cluster-binding NifX family protein
MEHIDHGQLSGTAREHAMHPRNYGPLGEFDGYARLTGACGDTMEFWIALRNDKMERVSFKTEGCGSSLACGSMTTCLAEGKSFENAAMLEPDDIIGALDGLPREFEHCALLAASTLGRACEDYLNRQKGAARDMDGRKEDGGHTCGDPGCSGSGHRHGETAEEMEDRRKLDSRLGRIRHKILVLSGKGGVGKSTVAVNLAAALALSGKRVGLMDVDVHGPSVPTMLGLEGETIAGCDDGILPIEKDGLKVMSLGILLRNQDDAVIWRGPLKMGLIKQFLTDVVWGDLDYLIVDSPPGTGDEPLSVCQLIGSLDGAVVVTTPQKVAAVDVRKSISFCRQLHVPVLGVVENMSGFACPKCGEVTPILRTGGGRRLAEDMGVPYLGAIPIDPQIAEACDDGRVFVREYAATATARVMRDIISLIVGPNDKDIAEGREPTPNKEDAQMRIAIPIANGKLSAHFGHCERFALVDVDPAAKILLKREDVDAPPHQPGLLPPWLAERGVKLIIAGGMGQRAKSLFTEHDIHVMIGAPAETPEKLVADYLAGTLREGENICDH